ncbi:MAG: RimK family alpha-L-glutamate ligase [Clostridia bacterium]
MMRQLSGWIVSNRFLGAQEKFVQLNQRMLSAASRRNLSLRVVTNDQLLVKANREGLQVETEEKPDFIIFMDKDVRLAQVLERSGMRLFNSAKAIEICDDKSLTALAIAGVGIDMPMTILGPKTFDGVGYTNLAFLDEIIQTLGFPIVVKECFGSFGQQVALAQDAAQLAGIVSQTSKSLVFQEFIAESVGRDIRINVVGGRVVASMLRTNPNDFRANVTNGASIQAYSPTTEESAMALQVCTAIGVDFAGVDLLFGKDGPVFCEINASAHIENIYQCTGIDVSETMLDYILHEVGE